ncbi:putative prophage antirepressor [Azorhizobium caulinodans ORS 571]|uniref:Putative prophage antirepressor n=1 Tax=Azorhizobium caulinodans (strain ATCC 43989 / DSM 5975 / JCM 20966 / LMG 6465 / NBRC 14845 / NCIMB 13405 / ORS 571) TaxID=438753 RepID=A8IFE1_AZOC5|nr:BRO family protein [Azorhizobium caulinodans]BAF89604.1 putative prophage antirepressor [Azorhizobium caulinodans ORS 571]
MNALTPFNYRDHTIRVVILDGEPWFVAADVCRALEMPFGEGKGTVKRYLGGLLEGETRFVPKSSVHSDAPTSFPNRGTTCISESGLYRLTMRSNKPGALPFQNWVVQEVLPAIRKDGGYILGEELHGAGLMSDDELLARALQVANRKLARVEAERNYYADHYELVTVDEWRATSHLYLQHGQRVQIGKVATALARNRGIILEKQTRTLSDSQGRGRVVTVNVYPRKLLDEAAANVCAPVQRLHPTN